MFGIGMAGADPATVALMGRLYLYLAPVAIAVALLIGRQPADARRVHVFLRDEDAR